MKRIRKPPFAPPVLRRPRNGGLDQNRQSERVISESKSIRCAADDKGADLIGAGGKNPEADQIARCLSVLSARAERRSQDGKVIISLSGDRPRTVQPTAQSTRMQDKLIYVKTLVNFQARILGFSFLAGKTIHPPAWERGATHARPNVKIC